MHHRRWKKRLLGFAVLMGWMLAGFCSASDLSWLKAHSASPDELVLPDHAPLNPYFSPAATGPFRITVEPCAPSDCSSGRVWDVSGAFESLAVAKQAWASALEQGVPHRLLLDSDGGKTEVGLYLAKQVWLHQLDVEVPNGSACVSACVYVLTAGRQRTVQPWAMVGVHQQNNTKGWVAQQQGLSVNDVGASAVAASPAVFNLGTVVTRIDQATAGDQEMDGFWAYLMVTRDVSPLLLYKASMNTQTLAQSKMGMVTQTCAIIFNLDNTTPGKRPSGAETAEVAQRHGCFP